MARSTKWYIKMILEFASDASTEDDGGSAWGELG